MLSPEEPKIKLTVHPIGQWLSLDPEQFILLVMAPMALEVNV